MLFSDKFRVNAGGFKEFFLTSIALVKQLHDTVNFSCGGRESVGPCLFLHHTLNCKTVNPVLEPWLYTAGIAGFELFNMKRWASKNERTVVANNIVPALSAAEAKSSAKRRSRSRYVWPAASME